MSNLSSFFKQCKENFLSVAFYRLPNESEIKIVAGNETASSKKDLKKLSGIVFAPFMEDKTFRKVFIPAGVFATEKQLKVLNLLLPSSGISPGAHIIARQSSKKEFISLVKKIKKKIKSGKFEKVVAARVVNEKRKKDFDEVKVFKALCSEYPSAFVSLVYTPDYGIFIGASPEVLLSVSVKEILTYSLAGTQQNNKSFVKKGWGKKEIEEQKIVSDFILTAFKSVTNQKPKIYGPVTVEAGNLLHLRTTFTYKNNGKLNLQKTIDALHPTPAVSGFPKKKAVKFIQQNEKSQRGFYSGYLGTVNLEDKTELFVNLRCMAVGKKNLSVYTGCGITADSNAEAEWMESKWKAETLLKVVRKR